MASTLPPDPYAALGLPKDATAGAIKTAYRKLALTCHPDKVNGDESLKRQKAEEFHKIQEAYDTIGDEDKRATYDAEVRLEYLRKEKLSRGGVEVKTARYDVRTAAPAGAQFHTTTAHRYEERKPTRSYDDERYDRSSSRKYDTYEASPKSYSRSARKEESVRVKVSSDRSRSDREKRTDRERRSDRAGKYVVIDDESSSNDEKARWEAGYGRRSDEDRRRKSEDEAQKAFADARKKAEDRRSYEERKEPRRHRSGEEFDRTDRTRKAADMENEAVRYIHRTRTDGDTRNSSSRTTSSREVPREYERSSRRPEPVRRSSARPSKDRPSSSGRDILRDRKGGIPEIVEWDDDRKAPPSFKHSPSSSPADLHVPRSTPQRSHTESSRDHRRSDTSPIPPFRRSETMPAVHTTSSSRRAEPRSTPLRSSESASTRDAETSFRTVPPAQPASSTKYYYPTPGGGVNLREHDVGVANGHRTVLREPERQRHRSPSPLTRPPMGPNRPSETGRPASSTIPPPLGRSATFTNASPVREERGRSNLLFGERESEFTRRGKGRQTSFSPDSISYAKKIGPDDIRWSGGRDPAREEREYPKPTLGRHPTYVY